MFEAASLARTENVWEPAATAVYVHGEVQASTAPLSSLQAKLLPASLVVNEKLGELSLLGSGGLTVISVDGAVVSIVQPYVAAAPVLPAASFALTEIVCGPAASPL